MNKNDVTYIYDAIREAIDALDDNVAVDFDDVIDILEDAQRILDKELEELGEASASTTRVNLKTEDSAF